MRGKITKLRAYTSGKGYFIGIDGKDYMFYGNPGVKVGEQAEYEEGKSAADGKPTIKTIRPTAIEAFVDEDKPRSQTLFRAHDQPQWQQEKDRDRAKFRLDCVRIAASLYSNDGGTPAEVIIKMAEKFEKYARGD